MRIVGSGTPIVVITKSRPCEFFKRPVEDLSSGGRRWLLDGTIEDCHVVNNQFVRFRFDALNVCLRLRGLIVGAKTNVSKEVLVRRGDCSRSVVKARTSTNCVNRAMVGR
mgnify:CR=1 FL=1